jgi:hypothetical protein
MSISQRCAIATVDVVTADEPLCDRDHPLAEFWAHDEFLLLMVDEPSPPVRAVLKA